jgi:hypothetical protein
VNAQLAFAVIPLTAAEILATHLELVLDALDDAAAWREQLEDEPSADAYRNLAADLERCTP